MCPYIFLPKLAGAGDVADVDEYCGFIEKGIEIDLINLNRRTYIASTVVNESVIDLIAYGYINLE